jgi:uncharacterized protein (TIGR04141 family)
VSEDGPTRTISVYLLRKHVQSASDALEAEPDELEEHRIPSLGEDAMLYVSRKRSRAPRWAALFDGDVDPPLRLARPSFSAVLLVEASKRLFALTFGAGGRWMLARGSYERNFGLRVALNCVDPEQIRSVQSRTFVDTALSIRRQVAEVSDIVGLDMDVQRDLLTVLEGSVRRDAVGKRLSGADSARLTESLDAQQIKSVCSALYATSKKKTYKKFYPWTDWVSEVTDPDEIAQLDERALRHLLDGEFGRFDVFPPEMVSEDVVDYGTGRNTTVMEPTRALLEKKVERIDAPDPGALAETLQSSYISARNQDGDPIKRWSWWECLYYEHRTNGDVLVLDRGLWFKVRRDEGKTVNDFAASLEPSGLSLPDATRAEIEKTYNARVASERTDLKPLDRKLVEPISGESRIEICDLFSDQGHLIHVKRRKGGSFGLSHLFGQAFVSSDLLAREPRFAPQVRDQLGEWGRLIHDPPRAGDHHVVLAVILAAESSGEGARALPFFSKVFMRQNIQALQTMGFQVHYDEIEAPI